MTRNRQGRFARTSVPIVRPYKSQLKALRIFRATCAIVLTSCLTAYLVSHLGHADVTSRAVVPCTTDSDCEQKNPDVFQIQANDVARIVHEQVVLALKESDVAQDRVAHARKQIVRKRARCVCTH